MMTGKGERAVNVRILPGDSCFNMACILMRLLPPKDRQAKGELLMSILRILARNQMLSVDPTIPQADEAKKGFLQSIMVKGMDNIFSKLLKELVPWMEKHKSTLDLNHPNFEAKLTYPADMRLASPGSIPRKLLTANINDFACGHREWHIFPAASYRGVSIGVTPADLKNNSTYEIVSRFI